MIKKLLPLCIFLNFVFSIGIKALAIPQSAELLAKSGIGISSSIYVNPSLISHNISPFVSFSKNGWFGDIEGQKISVVLENEILLSFETLSVEDIELRDEIANDTPLGFFGAYWYAFELNKKIHFNYFDRKNINLGYKVKYNFSKLYTETMQGYSLDIGISKQISDNVLLGIVIKNIGKESSRILEVSTIPLVGAGLSYSILDNALLIISDCLSYDDKMFFKVGFETNLPYINFLLGSTYSENYKDISFGIKVEYNDWSLIYGNLNHDNQMIGNPKSFEITKYF